MANKNSGQQKIGRFHLAIKLGFKENLQLVCNKIGISLLRNQFEFFLLPHILIQDLF